jgi:2-dehydro-3-deoxygluconokinase
MAEVITFGEAMIRMTPPDFLRLEQATSLNVTVGGSELNTAVGLSHLGMNSAWVSKLTNNPLGRLINGQAQYHGVDTSNVIWTNDARVGTYYVEVGSSPRASSVLYDRKGAAIATITPNEVDWAKVLKGARLFHVSGITPALSESARETTIVAINAAKKMGLKISFDVNFRVRLWNAEQARATFEQLFPLVDILISTSDDIEICFGLKGTQEEQAKAMVEKFGLEACVMTIRQAPTVLHGFWSSIAVTKDQTFTGRTTELELVDRIGSGDAYTAGFIYGYLTEGIQAGVNYGDAMSVLKHSIPGDFIYVTKDEIERQMKSANTKIVR